MTAENNASKQWLVALPVQIYKSVLAPFLGGNCRYFPSCSNYFNEAVAENGLLKGIALGAWRILRCQPFSSGGWDPAPARTEKRD
jgi:putative membrane protein insertion efficiency factor